MTNVCTMPRRRDAVEWRSPEDLAEAAARECLQDWLETQERITGWWFDRLGIGEKDTELAACLEAHRRATLRLKALI